MPTATDDLDLRRRRALYRAQHRGTKEMDWLLGRFAAAKLPHMNNAALTQFERLIEVTDVELQPWIMNPTSVVDPAFVSDIQDLRAFFELSRKAD
jgi:antitoxin CptB